ncbi:MAG: hypothetical protein V1820_04050, partial [archaeon]
ITSHSIIGNIAREMAEVGAFGATRRINDAAADVAGYEGGVARANNPHNTVLKRLAAEKKVVAQLKRDASAANFDAGNFDADNPYNTVLKRLSSESAVVAERRARRDEARAQSLESLARGRTAQYDSPSTFLSRLAAEADYVAKHRSSARRARAGATDRESTVRMNKITRGDTFLGHLAAERNYADTQRADGMTAMAGATTARSNAQRTVSHNKMEGIRDGDTIRGHLAAERNYADTQRADGMTAMAGATTARSNAQRTVSQNRMNNLRDGDTIRGHLAAEGRYAAEQYDAQTTAKTNARETRSTGRMARITRGDTLPGRLSRTLADYKARQVEIAASRTAAKASELQDINALGETLTTDEGRAGYRVRHPVRYGAMRVGELFDAAGDRLEELLRGQVQGNQQQGQQPAPGRGGQQGVPRRPAPQNAQRSIYQNGMVLERLDASYAGGDADARRGVLRVARGVATRGSNYRPQAGTPEVAADLVNFADVYKRAVEDASRGGPAVGNHGSFVVQQVHGQPVTVSFTDAYNVLNSAQQATGDTRLQVEQYAGPGRARPGRAAPGQAQAGP